MRQQTLVLISAFSLCIASIVPALAGKRSKTAVPATLSERDRALHALNRLTFGPRPGDVEKVMTMGINEWIEQQLNPGRIPNTVLDSHLSTYRTLYMSARDLLQAFPPATYIREAEENKRAMPSDPIEFGLWEVLIDRDNEQRGKNAASGQPMEPPDEAARKAAAQASRDAARHLADMLLSLPKANRMPALMKLPVGDRRTLVQYAPPDMRDKLLMDFSPLEREIWFAMNNPQGVGPAELQQAKVLRAVYSERQLEEVMTDFWFNHFNVFLFKDQNPYLITTYEREVIRPHALGKFRDLLGEVAKSPAMLIYLDNWQSLGPNSQAAGARPGQTPSPNASRRGLNENYGRELMELHTLGVDGGYTQQDVTEVARVFTGWTVQPDQGWGFVFDPRRHEPGTKTVLAKSIPESGINEGLQVLDILAKSSATAKFICTKLARRFVADDPPPALVQAMADDFLATDGDIKEVLRTMLHSKEFWSPAIYRKKVKTPLEFIVSAIRATGTEIQNPMPIVQAVAKMGMPLYQMQPPTGYSTAAQVWMNSDALLDRLNFSISLSSGGVNGVSFDPLRMLALGLLSRSPQEDIVPVNTHGGAEAAVTLVEGALIGSDVSKNTDQAIRKSLADPNAGNHLLDDPSRPLATIIGLTLGSPEFQVR
ncbi:MAG TPA: DUF1800 domain-containing protein [Terriglobales bacterium]